MSLRTLQRARAPGAFDAQRVELALDVAEDEVGAPTGGLTKRSKARQSSVGSPGALETLAARCDAKLPSAKESPGRKDGA